MTSCAETYSGYTTHYVFYSMESIGRPNVSKEQQKETDRREILREKLSDMPIDNSGVW
ncbi:hypothetical protein [Legionella sp.]|uniref:hypothetical protein n=1 Tax=Legionella sp. TaxID=459 RepID=UPI003C8B5BB4